MNEEEMFDDLDQEMFEGPYEDPLDKIENVLEVEGIKSNRELYCPPILDMDAKLAAHFMTLEDSEEALKKLLYCFKVIDGKEAPKYTLLERLIMHGATNFDWFAKMTEELSDIIKEEAFFPPVWLRPEKKDDDYLYLISPMIYKGKKVKYVQFPSSITNIIDKNRYLYIKKQVQLEDFREGYPTWYVFSQMTLFEKYNTMTNVRVKIDFSKGEFRYYISGASDDWKEICDVPLEMDHVISALMFRN